MKRIHFTVSGKPKALIRHRDRYDKRGQLIITGPGGKTYTPKYDPSRVAKESFLVQALNNRPDTPIESVVVLACIFWMPIPKQAKQLADVADTMEISLLDVPKFGPFNFFAGCAAMLVDDIGKILSHTIRPDTSNLLKFVEDALQPRFWIDDSQIMPMGWKFYSKSPRTEVEILW